MAESAKEDPDPEKKSEQVVGPGADQNKQAGNNTRTAAKSVKLEFAKLAIYVLLSYLAFGLFIRFSPAYEFLVLRPEGRSELYDRKIEKKEEIKFKNRNGDLLSAWFFRVPDAKRVVLIHHGNAGNITHRLLIARDFLQLGISAFVYDYRGYGESTGRPSMTGLISDGQDAYDYLSKTLGYKADQIIFYGESIGTAVSCCVNQTKPCKVMILQSAPSALPDVARDDILWFRAYPDWVFPEPHFASKKIISQFKEPILFIHGKKDRTVPFQHSELLYAHASSPKKEIVLLPDAGHNDVQGVDEPQFFKAISKFLKETGCIDSAAAVDPMVSK